MAEDGRTVRTEYFPETITAPTSIETIAKVLRVEDFDGSLFVQQLEAAEYTETYSARACFFAADALARDIASRRERGPMDALYELSLEIHAMWEQEFMTGSALSSGDGRIPGLIDKVSARAGSSPDPTGLRLRAPHRKGIVHRLVEDEKAGWVVHWRAIAKDFNRPVRSTVQGEAPVAPTPTVTVGEVGR